MVLAVVVERENAGRVVSGPSFGIRTEINSIRFFHVFFIDVT